VALIETFRLALVKNHSRLNKRTNVVVFIR